MGTPLRLFLNLGYLQPLVPPNLGWFRKSPVWLVSHESIHGTKWAPSYELLSAQVMCANLAIMNQLEIPETSPQGGAPQL